MNRYTMKVEVLHDFDEVTLTAAHHSAPDGEWVLYGDAQGDLEKLRAESDDFRSAFESANSMNIRAVADIHELNAALAGMAIQADRMRNQNERLTGRNIELLDQVAAFRKAASAAQPMVVKNMQRRIDAAIRENGRLQRRVKFLADQACCDPVNEWGHTSACLRTRNAALERVRNRAEKVAVQECWNLDRLDGTVRGSLLEAIAACPPKEVDDARPGA
jgi:hypothetical protein